jgi:hypothetical protein
MLCANSLHTVSGGLAQYATCDTILPLFGVCVCHSIMTARAYNNRPVSLEITFVVHHTYHELKDKMTLPRRYTLRSTSKTFQQHEQPNDGGLKPTVHFLDDFESDHTFYDGESYSDDGENYSDDALHLYETCSLPDMRLERGAFGQALDTDSNISEILEFEAHILAHEEPKRLYARGKMYWVGIIPANGARLSLTT